MITRAKLLVVTAIITILCGCISSTTQSRSYDEESDAAEQNYQLGAQYFRNGSYDLARDRLQRALEFDSKMAHAHSMLALTYVQLGNTRLATESFDRAVRYGPNNQDVRNTYAVFLCGQGDYDEAQRQFDRAINIRENDNPEVMMSNAGVCMAKKPDLELAEQYFRQAIARKPSYGEALIQLAALKHRSEDNLTARAFLQRYLAANEATAAVLYLAIQIETNLGMEREATDYMNQLLRDFPDSPEARQTLTTRNQ
jgi:type IV pilus assembly protein PilF